MLLHRWRQICDLAALHGPLGLLVAVLPFVTLLSLALLPYAWRQSGRVVPLPVRVLLGLLAVGEIAALIATMRSRDKFARLVTGLDVDPGKAQMELARHLSAAIMAPCVAAVAVLVVVPIVSLIVLLRWRRGVAPADGAAWWVAPVAMVSMVWTAAAAGWRLMLVSFIGGFHWSREERYDAAIASFPLADASAARWIVLGLATLATCLLVAAARKLALPVRRRSLAWGAALLVAGGIAFGQTRPMAFDALHPLPYSDPAFPWTTMDLPLATRCGPASDGPLLEMRADGPLLDGVPVPTRTEAHDILKAKRELWKVTHPDPAHPDRTPPNLVVAARPESATDDVLPFVEAAREAGWPEVAMVLAPPSVTVITRTLGPVVRTRRLCSVPLPRVVSTGVRWGELAASIQRPDG
jgi:hypothetical protein